MIGFYIFIVSFFLFPIASFFSIKKTKNKTSLNKLLIFISLILFSSLIVFQVLDISFIHDTAIFIWAAFVYGGMSYLIWNVIFRKEKALKVLGIILAFIVFGIGLIFGITGTKVLDNEETHKPIVKEFGEYKMRINILETERRKIHSLVLYKHIGPFKKTILEKNYFDNFPENYSNIEYDYNGEKSELEISSYSSLTGEKELIWQDVVRAE